jgi:uncharacterized protein YegJ (DUF2314 family)
MKRVMQLIVAVLAVSAVACRSSSNSVTKRPDEPDVVAVQATDPEMNQAMAKARATIGEFVTRLDHPPQTQSSVSLKVRVEEGQAVEHLWLVSVTHAPESFTGVVNNQPLNLPNVHFGQSVSVPLDRVSDWLAVDHGHLIGGYTIRLLRSRMDPKERRQFDEQLGAVVD